MGFNVLLQEQNKAVASKLGTATALMFTLPFLVFYICFYFVFTDKEEPAAWSGGVSIVIVNIIVAGYIFAAFSEEEDESGMIQKHAQSIGSQPKIRTD
mmetsp:Transcript_3770/g.5145  ORF Transcript_3770/g.5145 Transcript_3770/m.5145 type:complete len:98 (+) Transcript_3770:91-384(+)